MSRILPLQKPTQRSPRIEEPDYLAWIRQLPCLVCGKPSGEGFDRTQPAHIRFNDARYLKITGGGEKSDDRFVLPLCWLHHAAQTAAGEGPRFWENLGMDPHAMSLALRYLAYPDLEAGERIVRAWHGWIRP